MAYFQIIWTQTGSGNPFNGENKLMKTETSGPFSSELNLRPTVIPYPPKDYLLSFDYYQNYSMANISWNPAPVPTPYEVNPVLYSWNIYNSTLSLLTDSGTTYTTATTSVLGNSSYFFMIYTFETLNYAGDYFYIFANSTGGGGTSSNSQSVTVQYTPPVMPTPSITLFSTFLQSGTYYLNLDFTFETPPAPALVVSTLFTIGLFSNLTPTGTYTTCTTIGYYTQQQNPTLIDAPNYAFNLYNYFTESPSPISFTLLPGYYYKTAMVTSDMLGNVSDSGISEQSDYQFYDPTLEKPSAATFSIFQSYQFSNFQVTPANMQYPPIPDAQLNINWNIFSSPNDTVYTTTGISGSFLNATPPGTGMFILPSPITGNAYYKMYVQSTDPLNRAKSSVYFSTTSAGVYAPPAIPPLSTITNLTIVDLTVFSVTFTVNSTPLPNTGWGFAFYSNSMPTGNYSPTNRSGFFPLTSASGGVPTYTPAVTTGTSPNYTFTVTSAPIGGGQPLVEDRYYKLVIQGIGSNGTRILNGTTFGPCLIGVSTLSDYYYIPAGF